MYRKKDEDGIEQGGPMYFIEVGLGKKFKPLAIMFALCGMVGCLVMFQSNQLAGLLDAHWGINRWITGGVLMLVVGIVILGGIRRIGQVTSKIVPTMCVLYFISAAFVILSNYAVVPALLVLIFKSAFGAEALIGGMVGVSFKEVLIIGIKRAAFSNEAGIGTAPMAHGAAKTKEPVREGLVAMMGPFLDTHIICTLTGLVILSTGVTTESTGVVMTVNAFDQAMPGVGKLILSVVIALFAVSTMISYSYYNLKCSRYLLGKKFSKKYLYVYLGSIPVAAVWSQSMVLNILDTAFALMAVPNLIATLLLSRQVIAAQKDYFARMRI